MGTHDDDDYPPTLDYYSNSQHYYYPSHPHDFSQQQLNNSFYDSNPFYEFSHPPNLPRVNDEETMYMPIYPEHSFVNGEFLYPTNSYDHRAFATPQTENPKIVVELANRPLWAKFASHTLENIITKSKIGNSSTIDDERLSFSRSTNVSHVGIQSLRVETRGDVQHVRRNGAGRWKSLEVQLGQMGPVGPSRTIGENW